MNENVQGDAPEVEVADVEAVEVPEDQPAPEPVAPEPSDPRAADEARAYGWKPLEEWKGDTSGWVPAEKFLELPSTTRKINEELRSRIARTEKMTQTALERQRQQMEAERRREIDAIRAQEREAVQMGDVDAYEKLAKRREELIAPPAPERTAPETPPDVAAYMEANPWTKDPIAFAVARQAVDLSPEVQRLPPIEQFRYAERKVREYLPQLFPAPAAPVRPKVDGGGTTRGTPAKTFSAIPAEDRAAARGMIGPGKLFADEADYAKSYWEA